MVVTSKVIVSPARIVTTAGRRRSCGVATICMTRGVACVPATNPESPGPGDSGFVAGTQATPRVMQIVATPQLRLLPAVVTIRAGETITFEVTTMGPTVHEFMVGPAADVATDKAGTPEIADLGMMQTRSLTLSLIHI